MAAISCDRYCGTTNQWVAHWIWGATHSTAWDRPRGGGLLTNYKKKYTETKQDRKLEVGTEVPVLQTGGAMSPRGSPWRLLKSNGVKEEEGSEAGHGF